MKKVVIIVTVLIFIASIAIVNILGGEILTLDGAIYPTKIEIDEVRYMDGGDNGLGTVVSLKKEEASTLGTEYFYEFYCDSSAFTNDNPEEPSSYEDNPVVRFTYHVYPEDATNKNVIIMPDASQQEKGYSDFNEDLCQITIKKQNRDVKYTIYSEHKPDVMIFISIICKPYN